MKTVHDGPFEGFQIYGPVSVDLGRRTLVLAYQGEEWGPRLA